MPLHIKKLVIILIIIVLLSIFLYYQNNFINTTAYDISSEKLPNNFEGFKIVQLSDIHNKESQTFKKQVFEKVKKQNPDIIVITGDLLDARNTKKDVALEYIDEAIKVAPVYYVSGNHEGGISTYASFEQQLINRGVYVLKDTSMPITIGNESINLFGLNDPTFLSIENTAYVPDEYIVSSIRSVLHTIDESSFTILLAHRPEYFDVYAETDIDLILSGHTHGGQITIPFIGGLFAPGQGFFPEYDAGEFTNENSEIIINRGLGNSSFPQRLFNQPEIVVITLHNK